MAYKHKNVHTIIKAKVCQLFVDLLGWMIRGHCEQKVKVVDGLLSQKITWPVRCCGGGAVWGLHWLKMQTWGKIKNYKAQLAGQKRGVKLWISLVEVAKNAKNVRQKMIWKTQDVPCQGNMEHNWIYGGEEGHWRISLVGKKSENRINGYTKIRKKETETPICAL